MNAVTRWTKAYQIVLFAIAAVGLFCADPGLRRAFSQCAGDQEEPEFCTRAECTCEGRGETECGYGSAWYYCVGGFDTTRFCSVGLGTHEETFSESGCGESYVAGASTCDWTSLGCLCHEVDVLPFDPRFTWTDQLVTCGAYDCVFCT
jgi:hypothetical protein